MVKTVLKDVEGSTLFLLMGLGIFGFGAYKFWELAVLPRVSGFVGA